MSDDDRQFEHDPVECEEFGDYVVVTRNPDAKYDDETVQFECGCAVGSLGAVKPDSWTGGAFL